jgi:hypothetical protein
LNTLGIEKLNDRWLRIGGIASLWIITIGASHLYELPITLGKIVRMSIALAGIIVTWHSIRVVILYFRRKYMARHDMFRRLLLTFLVGTSITAIIVWIFTIIRYLLLYGSLEKMDVSSSSITLNNIRLELNFYGLDLVRAGTTFLFFQILYEAIFLVQRSVQYQNRLKEAEREKERLQTVSLQSQLDALKQQVNPHFLFNSLNVLDSLIEEDPKQARLFLEELSTVYRYLLRANDSHLTTLQTELEFIQSYYHLLKTRYSNGLSLEITVASEWLNYQLPPLTLQLLVENAVKHNVVLPEQPLAIHIAAQAPGNLLVWNNLQRKGMRVPSNGVGLTNILVKYQMLGQTTPVVNETQDRFLVVLPLITIPD